MIDFIRTGVERALAGDNLATALARHVGAGDPNAARALARAIEPFVRSLVDAVAFAIRASKDEQAGRAITFANGQILHYLLDDEDLVPEAELGVVGLLDDALLVHHYAAQLVTWYPWLGELVAPYAVPSVDSFALVRDLLPDGVTDALERTSRSVLTTAATLIGTHSPPGAARAAATPTILQLDRALARLATRPA
jgi:hypothetical protein